MVPERHRIHRQTGLALLALAGGSFLASGLTAPIGRKRGTIFIVRLGIVLEIIGIGGLAIFLRPDSTWLTTTPLLLIYGIGVGFATAQLTGVVLTDVPLARSGEGSGIQSTSRQVGSALGIAILGTVLFATLGARYDTALADLGVSEPSECSSSTQSKTAREPRFQGWLLIRVPQLWPSPRGSPSPTPRG